MACTINWAYEKGGFPSSYISKHKKDHTLDTPPNPFNNMVALILEREYII